MKTIEKAVQSEINIKKSQFICSLFPTKTKKESKEIIQKLNQQYHDAIEAFDKGDMQSALDNFFLAIHSRYDIEKPSAKRLIRRKLGKVNSLIAENEQLREIIRQKEEEKKKQEKFLKQLATEYTLLGKECEKEGMPSAAIANYQKALKLCPEHPEANRRLKKLNP